MTDYDLEERAAILEYDGGLTREEAERRANEELREREERRENGCVFVPEMLCRKPSD